MFVLLDECAFWVLFVVSRLRPSVLHAVTVFELGNRGEFEFSALFQILNHTPDYFATGFPLGEALSSHER
jgi:hypothetical protein